MNEAPDARGRTRVRLAAALAIGIAAVFAVWALVGGDSYQVRARFQAATQMVKGNEVKIAGRPVGLVKKIELTADGEAELTLEIEDEFVPLREGTQATLRIASLSGVVNRYVDLRIPPAPPGGGGDDELPDGGVIASSATTSAVDIDQLFALFDKKTRKGLTNVIRGSAAQYEGAGKAQNEGWRYLNPSLVAAERLFAEINRDTPLFERFVVESLASGHGRGRPARRPRRAHRPARDDHRRARPGGAPRSRTRSGACRRSCGAPTPPSSTSATPSTTWIRSSPSPSRSRRSCGLS